LGPVRREAGFVNMQRMLKKQKQGIGGDQTQPPPIAVICFKTLCFAGFFKLGGQRKACAGLGGAKKNGRAAGKQGVAVCQRMGPWFFGSPWLHGVA